jgi:hypothetical protein
LGHVCICIEIRAPASTQPISCLCPGPCASHRTHASSNSQLEPRRCPRPSLPEFLGLICLSARGPELVQRLDFTQYIIFGLGRVSKTPPTRLTEWKTPSNTRARARDDDASQRGWTPQYDPRRLLRHIRLTPLNLTFHRSPSGDGYL